MINMDDYEVLKQLRKKIFITGYRGGMAHLASCYSCIEMIYALYCKDILKYDPSNPKWDDRDRFILSKGHAGLALYSVLAFKGLISESSLDSYLTLNAEIGGEPCMRDCDWVEATTGSLGHGLSLGMGMAMALKSDNKPSRVYVMIGDGESQEGSIWEAAMAAPSFGLDNLVVILDNNRIQKMDFTENTLGNPRWDEKWKSFGWDVKHVDGHNVDSFTDLLNRENDSGKPLFVIADTVKGKGVSIMENNPNWHFKLPGRKDLKVFMSELSISEEELY